MLNAVAVVDQDRWLAQHIRDLLEADLASGHSKVRAPHRRRKVRAFAQFILDYMEIRHDEFEQ